MGHRLDVRAHRGDPASGLVTWDVREEGLAIDRNESTVDSFQIRSADAGRGDLDHDVRAGTHLRLIHLSDLDTAELGNYCAKQFDLQVGSASPKPVQRDRSLEGNG
jgi:hypothetical protein